MSCAHLAKLHGRGRAFGSSGRRHTGLCARPATTANPIAPGSSLLQASKNVYATIKWKKQPPEVLLSKTLKTYLTQ